MSLTALYLTNVDAENKGVELELGTNNGKPIKFLCARRGGANKQYKKAVERNTKPVRRLIDTNSLTDEQDRRIQATIYAEACLKGWENVPLSDLTDKKEDENTTLEFSVENAVKLLIKLPELASSLYSQTTNSELYLLDREEDEKN